MKSFTFPLNSSKLTEGKPLRKTIPLKTRNIPIKFNPPFLSKFSCINSYPSVIKKRNINNAGYKLLKKHLARIIKNRNKTHINRNKSYREEINIEREFNIKKTQILGKGDSDINIYGTKQMSMDHFRYQDMLLNHYSKFFLRKSSTDDLLSENQTNLECSFDTYKNLSNLKILEQSGNMKRKDILKYKNDSKTNQFQYSRFSETECDIEKSSQIMNDKNLIKAFAIKKANKLPKFNERIKQLIFEKNKVSNKIVDYENKLLDSDYEFNDKVIMIPKMYENNQKIRDSIALPEIKHEELPVIRNIAIDRKSVV